MQELKFYVMADPHFYESSLGASGPEYDDFMRYEQKCYAETESINRSVVDYLKEADEADIVLIVGDLSFNGEKESHLSYVKLLRELQEKGKKVYVVTADHDCQEHPFAFGEKGRYEPENTPRDELYDIYYEFGFKDAIAVDRQHLSYVAQLGEGVRLLALNNDGADDGRRRFDDAHCEWIREQIRKAKEDGQMMIAMNHYPLLPLQPLFSVISSVVQKEPKKAIELLADEGVNLVFTGHMHCQSINEITTEKGNKLYDVCTGAIIADPAYIRLVTVKDENTVDIKSIPTPDFEWDTKGKTCKQYLTDMFDNMILNILYDMKYDTMRMMRKFHIESKKALRPVIYLVGCILNSITFGGLSRLMWIKCDKSIRKMLVKDFAAELVRGAFVGNQQMKEGTPKGDVLLAFLKRINPVLKKISVKNVYGEKVDLYELLKHTAGNYGIDDYNTVLKLKEDQQ